MPKRLAYLKFMLALSLCTIFMCVSAIALAQNQQDSAFIKQNPLTEMKVENQDTVKKHSPKKAALLSAILPGTGQIYNKKYWKAPIVYAALGTSVYFFATNRSQYNEYRSAYLDAIDTNKTVPSWAVGLPADRLRAESEQFRSTSELAFIGVFLVYLLQIVDATVDAHLFTFNVSDDLSLRVVPTQQYNYTAYKYNTGLNLSLQWRF